MRNCENEIGIKRRYIENTRNKRLVYSVRVRMMRNGATLQKEHRKLDRKIEKCYPRGKAFFRIIDIHTAHWATTNGK